MAKDKNYKFDALFSSAQSNWETPVSFFEGLNQKYNFAWDLAATEENTKCEKFITPEEDTFTVNWSTLAPVEWLFLNPPYGRGIDIWLEKYKMEIDRGAKVAMLVPSRLDKRAFHMLFPVCNFCFVKGRLKFLIDSKEVSAAPFPSVLIIPGTGKMISIDRNGHDVC